MSKKKITYIHIFIWLFAIFANLPFSNINQSPEPRQIVASVIAFLYLMVVFYFFYLAMVPFFLKRKKIDLFFGLSFLVVLAMPFLGYSLLYLSRALFDGTFHNFYHDYSLKTHMSGYYPVLTAAVFGSLFGVIINWFRTMNQKAVLDSQKLTAELDLLKSKLNPHFLFNTLNNIDSLIHQDSSKASAALIRLSDMMRYLTYETSAEAIDLEREIEYLRNLIELHRMRIKTPEDIQFDFSGDVHVMISPALFMPLVENAFKFASFRTGRPCVDIKLSSRNGIVVYESANYYEKNDSDDNTSHSGYGIINLKKRLDLAYGGRYQLNIQPGENLYHVNLTINTNAD